MKNNLKKNKKSKVEKVIPLIYAYLYMKIKKVMRGNRISGSELRIIIQREILCKRTSSSTGGDTKGLPRRYCYDIINDLVNLGLLERIDRFKYEDKRILEAKERLRDWDFNKKLKKNKKVMEELGPLINLVSEDPIYKVVRSNCDKLLREVFW